MDTGQRNLELTAEHRLVDEQEIPDQQGVFHARRGNTEGFDEIGPQYDPNQERRADRLQPRNRLLLGGLRRRFGRFVGGWRWLWRTGRRHGVSIQSAMKIFVSPWTLPFRFDAQTS